MYRTPAVHSLALLGGVPNLQVDYTTGLKPLSSILSIRAMGKGTITYQKHTTINHAIRFIIFLFLTHIPY